MWRELIANAKERKVFHNMVEEGEIELRLMLTRNIESTVEGSFPISKE